MAKNLLAALFFAVFSYSLWIYVNRDEKSLKANLQRNDSEDPKFLVEDVVIHRYKESKLETRIQAGRGKFLEPNLLDISGGLKVDRITENKVDRLVANNALASFETTSSKGIITAGDLVSAKLNQDVNVDFAGYRLLTDYAEYLAREDAIISDRPVTVQGEKTWFRGKSGFRVELGDQTVEIFGKANGEAFVK